MIDKNGKLFGKINIIDLLIILALVAAAAFFALRSAAPSSDTPAPETSRVRAEFFGEEVLPNLADSLNEGAPAFEDTTNVQFGSVVSFNSEPSYEYALNEAGESVKLPTANQSCVTVTVELEGTLDESGLHIGSRLYSVGGSYVMHFGTTKVYCVLSELAPAD